MVKLCVITIYCPPTGMQCPFQWGVEFQPNLGGSLCLDMSPYGKMDPRRLKEWVRTLHPPKSELKSRNLRHCLGSWLEQRRILARTLSSSATWIPE